MAIRGGSVLHVGNGVTIIDRLQSAGPGDLNIPEEKVYELGNFSAVATVRDIPDIQFSMESFDVSAELEALLTGGDFESDDVFDMTKARSIDIASPWKSDKSAADPFKIIASVGLPGLMPESVTWSLGLREFARQTVNLRGDSIFYAPGSIRVETATGTGTGGQTIVSSEPAGLYEGGQGITRVLAVTVGDAKLSLGPDYTVSGDTTTPFQTITVTLTNPVAATDTVRLMYFTNAVTEMDESVHEGVSVKPAAIRGKDIDIYVGGTGPEHRWTGVQSTTVNWRATIDRDEEFGNYVATSIGFDVPTADGTIEILFRDPEDMFRRIRQITGVTATDRAVGPDLAEPLPMYIVLKDGAKGGEVIKVLGLEAARFTVPGYTGRANEKLTQSLTFSDDEGRLKVYKAFPPPTEGSGEGEGEGEGE